MTLSVESKVIFTVDQSHKFIVEKSEKNIFVIHQDHSENLKTTEIQAHLMNG
jgi:hypothetical protein